MSASNAIEVQAVSKRFRMARDRRNSIKEVFVRGSRSHYEEFWALRDVTLQVPKGSVFGLIGHNGSGKSTLLKLMAKIHRPTAGSVKVDGRLSALLELGAGFHPELSGLENIRLNGAILGLSRREIDRAIPEIVEFSGLGEFIDNPVKVYSSGMYVRLGFSVAVHVRPDVLLVDEVIAVGDEEFQRRCFDHLHQLRQNGATIVLVSHGLGIVQSLCDEAAWMEHGRLQSVGRPDLVIGDYLESVNAHERERLGAEDQFDEPGRHGSGEIRIERIELLDGSQGRVSFHVAGDPATVRVWFACQTRVDNPVLGIGFHHESGAHVAGPNTRQQGLAIPCLEGTGYIDFVMTSCPLNVGTYQISAAAVDDTLTHMYDYRDKAFELRVRQGARPVRIGIVDLPGRFTAPVAALAGEPVPVSAEGSTR